MGPLRNPRREAFVRALFEGKSAHQAYADAGYRPCRQNAARMMTFDDIKARLAELQEEAAKASEITVEGICAELDEAIAIAKERGQASAMVSASALRAKLGGLLIDRAQVEVTTRDPAIECATMDELCRKLADERFDGLTNARWLPITEEDRRQLAALFARWGEAIEAFVEEVNSRPLINTGAGQAMRAPEGPKPINVRK